MKKTNEFKPLWNLVKDERFKIIIASIMIFLVEMVNTLTGYLNGAAIEAITKNNIKIAVIFLVVYFVLGIIFDSIIYRQASAMLQSVENKITRKLEFNSYSWSCL